MEPTPVRSDYAKWYNFGYNHAKHTVEEMKEFLHQNGVQAGGTIKRALLFEVEKYCAKYQEPGGPQDLTAPSFDIEERRSKSKKRQSLAYHGIQYDPDSKKGALDDVFRKSARRLKREKLTSPSLAFAGVSSSIPAATLDHSPDTAQSGSVQNHSWLTTIKYMNPIFELLLKVLKFVEEVKNITVWPQGANSEGSN